MRDLGRGDLLFDRLRESDLSRVSASVVGDDVLWPRRGKKKPAGGHRCAHFLSDFQPFPGDEKGREVGARDLYYGVADFRSIQEGDDVGLSVALFITVARGNLQFDLNKSFERLFAW